MYIKVGEEVPENPSHPRCLPFLGWVAMITGPQQFLSFTQASQLSESRGEFNNFQRQHPRSTDWESTDVWHRHIVLKILRWFQFVVLNGNHWDKEKWTGLYSSWGEKTTNNNKKKNTSKYFVRTFIACYALMLWHIELCLQSTIIDPENDQEGNTAFIFLPTLYRPQHVLFGI